MLFYPLTAELAILATNHGGRAKLQIKHIHFPQKRCLYKLLETLLNHVVS